MYLPENDAQLHDILTELRIYAQTHALTGLAEELDDALVVLAAETRRIADKAANASAEEIG